LAVRRLLPLLLVAASLLLAGCGGDDDSTDTSATDTVTLPASGAGKVYWLRDGMVWPVARELPSSDTEAEALAALFAGPTDEESSDLEATTAITGGDPSLTIEDGVARVEPQGELSNEALSQIVYTLTQFPTVTSVEIDGKTYTRKSFEEQTPGILVESPLPFAEVTSPITASGTANTFEATFNYELLDADGQVVDENFVTATSGTGTRGTFEFTTGEFDDVRTLVVYEPSAEDGSRTKLVEIPLTTAS
jgi:germination protein M